MKSSKMDALYTLMLAAVFSACGAEHAENTESGTDRIDQLVKRFESETDPATLDATVAEFKALSAEELDRFDEARERFVLAQLAERATKGDRQSGAEEMGIDAIGAERIEEVRARVKAATGLRKRLNTAAVDTYGRPYNRLSAEELDTLLPALQNGATTIVSEGGREPLARTAQAATSCDSGTYPLTARASGPTLRFGTGWSTYYENHVNGQSDCDLVYAYRGTFTRMRPVTPKDTALLLVLGNQTAMRHTGYSDIVLGTNKVWVIYGHPALVTLRMY